MSAAHHAPAPGQPAGAQLLWLADGGRRALSTVVLPLLLLAAGAWIWTARSASMSMSGNGAFVLAWLVMMVAMMLPAVAPVVALYTLAARRGRVASVPVFLAGYLSIWALSALPAWAVSRAVSMPLMEGHAWVARLTGATLLAAAAYQLTPLKARCLRHCRTPMSFFLARSKGLSQPTDAYRAGAMHGLYCLGCCWALMAVLVVLGGMQLGWALALAVVISAEKLAPHGGQLLRAGSVLAAGVGLSLVLVPSLLDHLVRM